MGVASHRGVRESRVQDTSAPHLKAQYVQRLWRKGQELGMPAESVRRSFRNMLQHAFGPAAYLWHAFLRSDARPKRARASR
jgi:hypothetical protein